MTVSLDINGNLPTDVKEFQIEGVTYFIQTRWNIRMGWSINFYRNDPTKPDPTATLSSEVTYPLPILSAKAMPNGALSHRYKSTLGDRIFRGEVIVLDMEAGDINTQVGRNDFGQNKRFQLVYFTEEELQTFQISSFTSYGSS